MFDKEIARLERIAQCARKAIGRSQKRQADLEVRLHEEKMREARTRAQQLDRANRHLADLLDLKKEIEGEPPS